MSTYGNMLSDMNLLGMASLIGQDFGALLNKCQREEVESYPWSFLFQEVVVNAIGPVSTGLASITQGTNVVTFQGGFNPLTMGVQPGWFIWLGPTLTTPFIVSSVSATNVILSSLFQLPTQTNLPCAIQPLYYSVYPLQTIFRVRQIDELIETSRAELDGIDPSRVATGGTPAIRWANAPFLAQAQSFGVLQAGGPFHTSITLISPTSLISVGDVVTVAGNDLVNGSFTISQVNSPISYGTTNVSSSHAPFGNGGFLTDAALASISQFQIEFWPRVTSGLPYIVDGKVGATDMVADTDMPMIPSAST